MPSTAFVQVLNLESTRAHQLFAQRGSRVADWGWSNVTQVVL